MARFKTSIFVFIFAFFSIMPFFGANAQPLPDTTLTDNAIVRVLCRVLAVATGPAGKAFAAIAVISLGIGFFTGKLSWGLIIGLMLGIAAMFGAASIVGALSGGGKLDCSATSGAVS